MQAYKNDLFECRKASGQLTYWSKSPGKPYFIINDQKEHTKPAVLWTVKIYLLENENGNILV